MSTPPDPTRAARHARWLLRLLGLWVLTGALFKLLLGTPADLPRAVRELPLELGLTYNLVVAIELGIAFLALLRPRWAWPPAFLLLLAFDGVLVAQIAAGETSCGCFGSKVHVSPAVMLAIDGSFLAGLLLARPWSLPPGGIHWLGPTAAVALAIALPWLFERQLGPGEVVIDGRPAPGQWTELAVEKWVGQDIGDTPLGQPPLNAYLDVNALFLDGLWVFYRSTCEHCARHLEDLARTESGEHLITLVRLEEPTDTEGNRIVHVLPSGDFVQYAMLPASISYIVEAPAELLLEAGKVVAAREGVTPETGLLAPGQ